MRIFIYLSKHCAHHRSKLLKPHAYRRKPLPTNQQCVPMLCVSLPSRLIYSHGVPYLLGGNDRWESASRSPIPVRYYLLTITPWFWKGYPIQCVGRGAVKSGERSSSPGTRRAHAAGGCAHAAWGYPRAICVGGDLVFWPRPSARDNPTRKWDHSARNQVRHLSQPGV